MDEEGNAETGAWRIASIHTHFKLYFIAIFWIWSLFGRARISVFWSFIPAALCAIPLSLSHCSISGTVILFSAFTMLFGSLLLCGFDPSYQLFLVFLQFDFFETITNSFFIPAVSMVAQGLTLFLAEPANRYVFLLLGFIAVSSFAIVKFGPPVFRSPFSLQTTCLIAFVHIFNHKPVSAGIFFISLFLSIPRVTLPRPTEPVVFTSETKKSLIYVVITVVLSVSAVNIGLQYHALAVVSDGVMSCCNCFAILGSILADIIAKLPQTSRFSYGFKRTPVIADFAVAIVLLIVSANFMSTSISSLVHTPDSEEDPPNILFVISFLGIVTTIWGSIAIGNLDFRACSFGMNGKSLSIVSDLFSSVSALIATVVKVKFHVESLDPFVSLLISCVIFGMAVKEMREVIGVLSQMCPENVNDLALMRAIGIREGVSEWRIWMLDMEEVVVTVNSKDERVMREFAGCAEQFGIVDWTVQMDLPRSDENTS
jgi:cation diffusion facilitator family transporter